MARKDWDIRGIPIYYDEEINKYLDVYEYVDRHSHKYINILYIYRLLNISEQRFTDLLNEPIESKKHLITSEEERIRKTKEKFRKDFLFEEGLEYHNFIRNMPIDEIEDSIYFDLAVELADLEYWLDDNWELLKENNVKHDEEENIDSRIASLEAENATLKAENNRLRDNFKELECTAKTNTGDDIPYTLWREVLTMRKDGMIDKQIAERLYDKGQGLSKAQLGALLYIGKSSIPAQRTLQDYGTKLFR